ncbi:MAG: ATP-binding protein [Chitinispirillales bacterium]|jgi:anti-sigma regulatory factor (Ser/Thr protein kinase)|nr:ATP-binding protein [Chitinispirillales bacterium]
MPSVLLSEEFDEVAFLRFLEDENFESGAELFSCFEKIVSSSRKFVILDAGAADDIPDDVLLKIFDFASKIGIKYFHKLCFVGRSRNLQKKIEVTKQSTFLKFFYNVNDAINYFYWDFCKNRDTVNIRIPADLEFVPSIRGCVSDFAELCGISKKTVFQIEMIVDELCNNAIEHGAQDECKAIEVLCSIGENKVEINVYNGYSFKAMKGKTGHEIEKSMEKWADSPNKTENDFRGRGLALVKKLSDDFEINSSFDGTWVHVVKKKGESDYANAD